MAIQRMSFKLLARSIPKSYNTYSNNRIALTKLDILDVLPEIKVGVAYRLNGKELNHFPTSTAELGAVEVDYVTLPGWMTSTEGVRTFDDLPENARKYVELIEDKLGLPGMYSFVLINSSSVANF